MHRILTTSCFVCWAALALGQGKGLEKDFDSLSAKERSRIAKAEEEGAIKDAQYQAVMAKAEEHFREQRFEAALEQFMVARDLRPNNVYPRVKIQDLQALIAKREAFQEIPVDDPASPAEQPAVVREVLPSPGRVDTTPGPLPTRTEDHHGEQHRVAPLERTEPAARAVDAPLQFAEGERIYKEGRAVVVERSISVEGRPTIFRKVTHAWGEVMYFKDGTAIPERVWIEAFGAR